jgi:hypothetical protein
LLYSIPVTRHGKSVFDISWETMSVLLASTTSKQKRY